MAKQPKALNRTPKERGNTGVKHKKVHLTPLQLVLMNKGFAHPTKKSK